MSPHLPDLPAPLTDRVAFLLQLALARAQAMGEQALAELDLSGREYGALAVLQGGSPDAQHRVGAALGVDRTSTVTLVAGLERRGLISRTRDPGNRRAYRVSLTERGEELRATAALVLADCDDRFLRLLPAADRTRLRTLLRRLLEPPT